MSVAIALGGKRGAGLVALVDDEDAVRALTFRWHFSVRGYAVTDSEGRKLTLHRLVLGALPGDEIDHRNGDKLDNQRSNLRRCTHVENMRNQRRHKPESSIYKGVTWDRARRRWHAKITVLYKTINLGRFPDEASAAHAYDAAAREHFAEFARTNFA